MSTPEDDLRETLLGSLRGVEPDNHLVDCPDTVLIHGSRNESIPDPAGDGRWLMLTWTLQCGHGTASAKFENHLHIVKKPEANGT